jgi:hypothetical protein
MIQATQGNQINQGKEHNTLAGQSSGEIHKTEEKDGKKESIVRANSKIGREMSVVSQKSGKDNANTSMNEEKKNKKIPADSLNIRIGPEIFVSLKKGSLADNYEIGKVLGEGAFGKVCLVTHKTTSKSFFKNFFLKKNSNFKYISHLILLNFIQQRDAKGYEINEEELTIKRRGIQNVCRNEYSQRFGPSKYSQTIRIVSR